MLLRHRDEPDLRLTRADSDADRSEDARSFYLHLVPELEASPTDGLYLVLLMKDTRRSLLR